MKKRQPTFQYRCGELPHTVPTAFTEEFAGDPDIATEWNVFLSSHRLDVGDLGLLPIIRQICLFLMPPMIATAH